MNLAIKESQPKKKSEKNTIIIRIPIRCSGTDLVTIFQSIFFNSLYEDVIKEINCLKIFCLAIISSRKKQARRDSNPQHAVLETAALPVGATGLNISKTTLSLFRNVQYVCDKIYNIS